MKHFHEIFAYVLPDKAPTLSQRGHAQMRSLFSPAELQSFLDNALDREAQRLYGAIAHSDYAYSRAGVNGYGAPNGLTHIYHHAPGTPRGVKLAASGESVIADYIVRQCRNNSPLSPTER